MRLLILLLIALMPSLAMAQGNTTNDSFSKAKKMLKEVYRDHRVTIYCGADYDNNGDIPRLPQGFATPAHLKRVHKIEWEHAVPAENFGRAFVEWREGDPQCVHKGKSFKGRNCAEKASLDFRYMHADMYNLFPSIGSVNAVRGNKQYSELPGEKPDFGACPAKVEGNRFEPPDSAKGQLARAALYMDDSYPRYNLSRQQRQLFEAWDKMYPVDPWECERGRRIERLQGNENKWIKIPCQKAGL